MENFLTLGIITYKRRDSLERLLTRLTELKLPDVSILVCDNCSKDGTHELCDRFKNYFSCFKYHENEKNIGIDGNILTCAKNCKTKYLWYLSDDDLIDQTTVDYVIEAVQEGVDGVLLNARCIDDNSGNVLFESIHDVTENYTIKANEDALIKYIYWSTLITAVVINLSKVDLVKYKKYIGSSFVHLPMFWISLYNCNIKILGKAMIEKHDGNVGDFKDSAVVIWTKNWINVVWGMRDLYSPNCCRKAAKTAYLKKNTSSLTLHMIGLRKEGNIGYKEGRLLLRKVETSLLEKILICFITLIPCKLINSIFNILRTVKRLVIK